MAAAAELAWRVASQYVFIEPFAAAWCAVAACFFVVACVVLGAVGDRFDGGVVLAGCLVGVFWQIVVSLAFVVAVLFAFASAAWALGRGARLAFLRERPAR